MFIKKKKCLPKVGRHFFFYLPHFQKMDPWMKNGQEKMTYRHIFMPVKGHFLGSVFAKTLTICLHFERVSEKQIKFYVSDSLC